MRCFVTGAGGFIGGYLVQHLLESGWSVVAADIHAGPALPDVKSAEYSFRTLSVTDRAQTVDAVAHARPDVVFHLAAQSYPGLSWEKPALTFEVNLLGTIHVLDAVREAGCGATVVTVCSSAEYAPRTSPEPIREDSELRPSTPYGISKLSEDHAARVYFEQRGVRTVRVRPFYLVGPGKRGDVCSDFARGIVAIERGEARDLPVGNLDVVRDQLDVRDGVAALKILGERGEPGGVYNVCSGCGFRIGDVLAKFKAMAKTDIVERVDPARQRPVDEPVKIGDCSRLRSLGWAPRISIDQALSDVLQYWRAQPS